MLLHTHKHTQTRKRGAKRGWGRLDKSVDRPKHENIFVCSSAWAQVLARTHGDTQTQAPTGRRGRGEHTHLLTPWDTHTQRHRHSLAGEMAFLTPFVVAFCTECNICLQQFCLLSCFLAKSKSFLKLKM